MEKLCSSAVILSPFQLSQHKLVVQIITDTFENLGNLNFDLVVIFFKTLQAYLFY